jgi:type IX secretion system PorP/SprF family membrane protein
MKKVFLFFYFIVSSVTVIAQDAQFTQFYAAPLYHNPAFTGSSFAPRIIANYRNQWPSLSANFVTTAFSVDTHIDKINSGVGIMVLNDQQGDRLKSTEMSGFYSYQLRVGESNFLRLGLQGTYATKGVNPNGLIFGDQLTNNGYTGNPTQDPVGDLSYYNTKNSRIFDVSSGLLFYNSKTFLGVAVNHITEPSFNYLTDAASTILGSVPKINRKYTVNGGYNINLNHLITSTPNLEREFTVTPAFLYKKQGAFSQLDLGAYVTYTPLTFGLWYRGIPLKKVFTNFPNQDAIAGLVGFRFDSFSIGYSYDFTISGLRSSSGGAHEFSISYQFDKPDNDKSPYQRQRKKELACPKF